MPQADFMKLVQDHERQWGTESYPNRPDLADILNSPVVVFWRPTPTTSRDAKKAPAATTPGPGTIITLHQDMTPVHEYLTQVVLRSSLQAPDRRFVTAFMHQRQVRIKAVKVLFEFVDGGDVK